MNHRRVIPGPAPFHGAIAQLAAGLTGAQQALVHDVAGAAVGPVPLAGADLLGEPPVQP